MAVLFFFVGLRVCVFAAVYVCGIGAKVFNKQPLCFVPDRLIFSQFYIPDPTLVLLDGISALSASLHSARAQGGFPLVPLGRCRLFGGSRWTREPGPVRPRKPIRVDPGHIVDGLFSFWF